MFEKDNKVTGILNCSDSIRTERKKQARIKYMNGHLRQYNQKDAKTGNFGRADFIFSPISKPVCGTPLLSFQFLPR